MLKYVDTLITFSEVPKEISLCINISGCRIHCKDCHSKYLWEDIGSPLNSKTLDDIIACNDGITCVCIMGGHDYNDIIQLMKRIKTVYHLKSAWYTGESIINPYIIQNLAYFDYIKVGPYIKEKGALSSLNTNQVFYEVKNHELINKTYMFQKDYILQ